MKGRGLWFRAFFTHLIQQLLFDCWPQANITRLARWAAGLLFRNRIVFLRIIKVLPGFLDRVPLGRPSLSSAGIARSLNRLIAIVLLLGAGLFWSNFQSGFVLSRRPKSCIPLRLMEFASFRQTHIHTFCGVRYDEPASYQLPIGGMGLMKFNQTHSRFRMQTLRCLRSTVSPCNPFQWASTGILVVLLLSIVHCLQRSWLLKLPQKIRLPNTTTLQQRARTKIWKVTSAYGLGIDQGA